MPPSPGQKNVNSVMNAVRVLEEVSRSQPAAVGMIARELQLPKSTVQRLVLTLQSAGLLKAVDDGGTRWTLSLMAFTIGSRALPNHGLRESARPIMEDLAARTQETVHLMVPDDETLVSVDRIQSPRSLFLTHPLGGRAPYHATSPGKAVLAFLEADAAEPLLSQSLTRFTDSTITDTEALREQLVEIQAKGYAVNRGEWREGVGAVASPILVGPEKPIGAIAISIPMIRFSEQSELELGQLVRDAAVQVSRRYGIL